MPYTKVHSGEKWCVHKKNDDGSPGEKLKCYDTEKEANDYLAALNANVPDAGKDAEFMEDNQKGSMSLDQFRDAVWQAWDSANYETAPKVADDDKGWIREIFANYVVVSRKGSFWKVPYSMEEGKVTFAPESDWTEVKEIRDWVEVTHNAMKAISETEDQLIVGNYIVLFGGRDLEGIGSPHVNKDGSRGQYFSEKTVFDSDYTQTGTLYVDWEHGDDKDKLGNDPDNILGVVNWKSAKVDEKGIFVERVLNRRNKYIQWLERLVKSGLVGSSSLPVQKGVEIAENGEILSWPLKRDTLTVSPMEPRMMSENIVSALKALNVEVPELEESQDESGDEDEAQDPVDHRKSGQESQDDQPIEPSQTNEEIIMTDQPLTDIQAILNSDLPAEDRKSLVLAIVEKPAEAPAVVEPEDEDPKDPKPQKATAGLEGEDTPVARPPYEFTPATEAKPKNAKAVEAQKTFDAFYFARFGDEDARQKAIMTDIVGSDYRQQIWQMDIAYAKYLRHGDEGLEMDERKALKSQIFPVEQIMYSIESGLSVSEMKAVMVEAQGTLGGYAVPPQRQADFIKRLPGKTAIRGGGAVVVTLATGNSIEIPVYTGGDSQYVGALRGAWGTETQNPTEKNATVGMETVIANIYTYKVPMSQSMLEDAANLVSLVQDDILTTASIDEDNVFATGLGGQEPLGILPGGLNTLGIAEVKSGSAADLTADGLIELSDGIDDQYLDGSRWIFRQTTGSAIRKLKDANNNYLFDRDLENNKRTLLGYSYFRTNAMPAVAANAYPILFGHLSGYYIVERMGMTIQRFQDSGTGPNKVEFHVRRRVGGRLSAAFKLAVQKVSA